MLIGVVYYIRALAVKWLLLLVERETQKEAKWEEFFIKWKQFLANRSFSLISIIISLLAYSKAVVLSYNNLGSIY